MSRKYKDASQVLASLTSQRRGSKSGKHFQVGGLKTLTYNKRVQNKPATYALVCETLKYKSVLENVLRLAGIKLSKLGRDQSLVMVMLYDFLFGHGIEGGGAIKRALKTHEMKLRQSVEKMMKKENAACKEDLLPAHIRNRRELARFVRVNLIKAQVDDVLETLQKEFNAAQQDSVVPYVLALPPETDLHKHELVKSGAIVLQDKASTLPVHALAQCIAENNEPWAKEETNPNKFYGKNRSVATFDVIDGCAAPGNKTSQMAALLFPGDSNQQGGKVFAFDKSERRLDILKERMEQAGASNVVPTLQNFLEVDPADPKFSNVKAIVLDPSCSGSGMVGTRVDHLVDDKSSESDESNKARIQKLAEFQLSCIQKAMNFNQVEYISYSTCSIYAEENEHVVQQALASREGEGFCLQNALPQWHRRGEAAEGVSLSEDQLKKLARVDPKLDDTNGFFVAIFRRKSSLNPKKRARDDRHVVGEAKQTEGSSTTAKNRMKERRKRRRKEKRELLKQERENCK